MDPQVRLLVSEIYLLLKALKAPITMEAVDAILVLKYDTLRKAGIKDPEGHLRRHEVRAVFSMKYPQARYSN